MAKGDDVKAKKKNKALRKKLNRDPSTAVSARIAAVIAAKKRRHSGKRRQCQGMCFSLPTPEDPFNDRRGKEDATVKKKKKPLTHDKGSVKDGSAKQLGKSPVSDDENLSDQQGTRLKQMDVDPRDGENPITGDMGCPSKFLFNCLNSIRDSLVGDGEIEEQEKSFIAYSWGFEFWQSYSSSKDILEISGTSPSVQQIAWIASTAADSIQRKESELISLNSPFLLYLVLSQEKAAKVRSVCKPLKALGIHAVSLHAGALVEHQVNGLKSCDPEFVVATPERLWELVSLKAIDISGVALLVVDAVDSLSNCVDVVKRVNESISKNAQTVLFQGCCSDTSIIEAMQLQSILREPVQTLYLDDRTDRQLLDH